MKVRVLRAALDDLANGRDFYNRQQEALEITFSTASFPKSIHWCSMQEFTESSSGIIACWRTASLMPCIIEYLRATQSFFGCWIAAGLHDGSESLSKNRANGCFNGRADARLFGLAASGVARH